MFESLENRQMFSAATLAASAPLPDTAPVVSVPSKPVPPKPAPTKPVPEYLVFTMQSVYISS